jgi:hypothetical protein
MSRSKRKRLLRKRRAAGLEILEQRVGGVDLKDILEAGWFQVYP